MFRSFKMSLVFCAVCLGAVVRAEAVALPLSDPSFENIASVPSGVTPAATLNEWRGDPASGVATENGIVPALGNRMLRFMYTYPPADPIGSDCAAWQIVDVRPYQSYVRAGGTVLSGAAVFNRIAGNQWTDTEFGVGLKSYSQMPSSFHDETANVYFSMLSDNNPATWESCSASLTLPTNTQFVAVYVLALENVFGNDTLPEFDGH